MTEQSEQLLAMVIIGFNLGFLVSSLLHGIIFGSYEEGQIDSINGKIKYEKKENERGETVWTKIKIK